MTLPLHPEAGHTSDPFTSADDRRHARVTWYRMASSPTYHRANPDADGRDSWTRTGRATCGEDISAPATFIMDPTAPLPARRRICRNCAKVATLMAARFGRVTELQAWTFWWIYSAQNPRQAGVAARLLTHLVERPFAPGPKSFGGALARMASR